MNVISISPRKIRQTAGRRLVAVVGAACQRHPCDLVGKPACGARVPGDGATRIPAMALAGLGDPGSDRRLSLRHRLAEGRCGCWLQCPLLDPRHRHPVLWGRCAPRPSSDGCHGVSRCTDYHAPPSYRRRYVTAFVQAYLRPPWCEFQSLADDIYQPRKWLENRVFTDFPDLSLAESGQRHRRLDWRL